MRQRNSRPAAAQPPLRDAERLMLCAEQRVKGCSQNCPPSEKEHGSSQPQQPTTPACANLLDRHHLDRRPATIHALPWEIEENDGIQRTFNPHPASLLVPVPRLKTKQRNLTGTGVRWLDGRQGSTYSSPARPNLTVSGWLDHRGFKRDASISRASPDCTQSAEARR